MDDSLYHEMLVHEKRYWWFVAKHNIILHLIHRFLDTSADHRLAACDIGCGCGALLEHLSAHFDAIGVDPSPIARGFCHKRGLDVREGALPGALALTPKSFDLIILSDVLEHIDQDGEAVRQAARLLRIGGILVCTVPAHEWMWTQRDVHHHHIRRYSRQRFESLFRIKGLKPELMSYYNATLFPLMMVARLGKRILGIDRSSPDIRSLSTIVNASLRWIFEIEKHWLSHGRLPIGASLISIYRMAEVSV